LFCFYHFVLAGVSQFPLAPTMAAPAGPDPVEVEEEEDESMLDPEHPMLARVQEALTRQMSRAYEVQKQKVSEQVEELTRQRRKREDVGVQLYHMQQQLAKLQMNLEKVHENESLLGQMREQAEKDLVEVRQVYAESLNGVQEERRRYTKYQAELDQLAATIRQVEAFNDQMKSEIAVTRRATYKAEEAIAKLEGSKKSQDLLIDSLHERLKREQEQLALTEAQLIAQRRETGAAQKTLADAGAEMDAIRFEKKQLMAQWKTALIGMERRNEALQAVEGAMRKQREQELAIEMELVGLRKAIRAEEHNNELLTTTSNKLEVEIRSVDAATEASRQKRAAAEERLAMIGKSLEQTDAELIRIGTTQAAMQSEVTVLDGQVQKVNTAARKLEEAVMATVSDQTTLEKGTQNTVAEAKRVRKQVSEKEMAAAQLENELARLKVDRLNVRSHVGQLQATLKDYTADLAERDALMARYETEARRRNVEIEKKQHELDLLNRKFEALMAKRAGMSELDEDAGPLEATIVHLKKEIHAKAKACSELQREWISMQAELVAVENGNTAVADQAHELRGKLSILAQKRVRIAAELEREKKSIGETGRTSNALHIEMGKINRFLSEYTAKQGALADDNYHMEAGFTQNLKDNEREAVELETKIVGLKQEREQLLLDVVEAEKQARLIEQKIALERETQAALDPTVGASETRAMQREIHRMQLRHAQLQRRQEIMIADMERAIYKRDNIEAKGKTVAGRKGAPPTQAALQRQVSELTRKLKMTNHDVSVTQMQVSKLQEAQAQRGQEVDAARAELEQAKQQVLGVHQRVGAQLVEARLLRLPLRRHERLSQKLLAAVEGAYMPAASEAELQEQLEESQAIGHSLASVATHLGRQFQHLAPQIDAILRSEL
jgi:chromosome segregation ATPase